MSTTLNAGAIIPKSKGLWVSKTSYSVLNIVTKEGRVFISLKNANTSPLTDTNAWGEITGPKGDKGDQGELGNGISSIVLNQDYTLTINFTDGTSTNTASIRGEKGDKGERGLPGESGVTGDVSAFTVRQTIDPSATYGATDIAGAAALQAANAELTELEGGLHKFIGLTASITIPAALPAGYTILDYIANTSSSGGYIDTGIKPNDSNWKFEGSWMLTGAIEAYQAIMASYSTESANTYRIIYNNTSTTSVLLGANTKASAPTSSSVNGANEWNTFSIQYGTATINGTAVTLGTTAGTAITNNMCLFSNTAATKFLVGKMRRFKAWHNGTLVRDMIPCINPQSVYGMYDIVNNVFYGSSNENNFTGGN